MKSKVLIEKVANPLIAMSLLMFILILIGCEDKDYYDSTRIPPTEVGNDPSTLDFSTTQKVTFELNYDVPEGTVSAFQVYPENPFVRNALGGWDMRVDVLPIASGIHVAGGEEIVRTLPAYVTELYVYSPSLFVPTLMYSQVNNERASFKEVGLNMPINEEVSSRSMGNGNFDRYLTGNAMTKAVEGAGIVYYRPLERYLTKEAFPATVRNAITTAFPEGKKVDPKYYTDATIYIEQDGGTGDGVELWVSVVSSQAQNNNSLAYFCYDGPKDDLAGMTQAERDQLYVICAFQFAKSSPTMYGALRPGEYIKLQYYDKNTNQLKDKFPVGTTVGWVLSANGFVTNGTNNCYTRNRSQAPWYYSTLAWNPETSDKNHTIIFTAKDEGKEYVCFGFEDVNNESTKGDGDCNDVIFHVKMDPENAITPPPTIPEEGEIEETETIKGYLAFEDNWPKKGDYDLNDVVVKYESSITYVSKIKANLPTRGVADADPFVRRIEDRFSLVHAGADYANSFAYKVNIAPQLIKSITVDGSAYNLISDGNGFLVELCPNVNEVIVPYTYGTTPKDYSITVEFTEEAGANLTQYIFNENELCAPYNPYISPRSGIEVHLPMYPPTAKATEPLFGKEDDRSGEGLWYISGDKNNYPFAIHLSGITGFTIPVEKESIDKTYPKYNNWVDSGKTEDTDWYLYPKVN